MGFFSRTGSGPGIVIIFKAMEKQKLKGGLRAFLRKRTAGKVAELIGGRQALEEMMASAGYGANAPGLAARLAVELGRVFPLALDASSLRVFGRYFPGATVMKRARRQAGRGLSEEPPTPPIPASCIKIDPEELMLSWPRLSGQIPVRLARAHVLGSDPQLALAAVREIKRFCSHHPPLMGLGWTHSGMVAGRVANWLLALRFLSNMGMLDAEMAPHACLHLKVAGMVFSQELDAESRPGPDLICQAGALMLLGRTLAFLPEAETWAEQGKAALNKALKAWHSPLESCLPTLELAGAVSYAGLCLWVRQKAGEKALQLSLDLEPLARACRALAPPWGCAQGWGWSPLGVLPGLDQGEVDPYTKAANLAAVLLDNPLLRAGRDLDEDLYWLIGPSAKEKLRKLAGGKTPPATEIKALGIVFLCQKNLGRKVGLLLRTTSGRKGDQPELLSLAASLDGKPFLVTPGPVGAGPMSAHLASREAQNALCLDKDGPGPGVVELEALEKEGNHVFTSVLYQSAKGAKEALSLRRRIFLDGEAGLFNIVDQIQAEGEHLCRIYFHLPRGTQVEPVSDGSFSLNGPFGQAWFRPEPNTFVSVVKGRHQPPLGWLADENGHVAAAPVLAVQAKVMGAARITSVFAFEDKDSAWIKKKEALNGSKTGNTGDLR
ncbi:hypothetical protein [Dethiosulfatarculus sandiegensis]|uniref:Uncharacterized protein n=1 Tax=Dethiosulfatarculus sandiegensis TaxID=1429043 RepID=A0A0D2J0P7_9BACT|nr:hypothetical protein [Dethiosulfatarculus sandiegensis]KIX11829.1 hypothetical protein X474_22395 [Dethiosulfatarculus sandiegensis]